MCDDCDQGDAVSRPSAKPRRRLKLWEVKPGMHCSIVGTCLSHDDLLLVARRARMQMAAGTPDYDVHAYFVTESTKEGTLSRAMQKVLDDRHAGAVRKAMAASVDELPALWREFCQAGRVPGGYWALLTRADLPEDLRVRIFGEVHMMSHILGRSTHALASKANELASEVEKLEAALMRERQRHGDALRDRDCEIAALTAKLAAGPAQLPMIAAAASAAIRSRSVRRDDRRERALAIARARARLAESRIQDLEEIVARSSRPRVQSAQPATYCPAAATCDAIVDADRRRVLYLGGRQTTVDQLRAIAARANAELLHHDGGLEQSQARIDGLVEGCDLVVCPIDCVSHGACRRAKALCRKLGKPFVPLRSSGTTAFARALQSLPTG
jgi:hypothetical protein